MIHRWLVFESHELCISIKSTSIRKMNIVNSQILQVTKATWIELLMKFQDRKRNRIANDEWRSFKRLALWRIMTSKFTSNYFIKQKTQDLQKSSSSSFENCVMSRQSNIDNEFTIVEKVSHIVEFKSRFVHFLKNDCKEFDELEISMLSILMSLIFQIISRFQIF